MLMKPDWKSLSRKQKKEAIMPYILEGKSASQISQLFSNCTRNAFLGFCNRNEIIVGTPRIKTVKKEKSNRTTPIIKNLTNRLPKPIPKTYSVKIDPLTPPEDTSHIDSYQNTIFNGGCKWPLWDHWEGPEKSLCCNSPKSASNPYCDFHMGLTKGKGTEGERTAHNVLKKYG